MTGPNYQIKQPTSQFFAAQLLTQEWAQPINAQHRVFKAAGDVKKCGGKRAGDSLCAASS
jgi:hypothetical protein